MKKMSPAMQETMARLVATAMQARARGDGRPFVVACFVTNRCNCRCASCLWRHNDWRDVPLDDLKRFYGEARELGFVATALTGGEPFLRKDLGELVRFLDEDLEMSILTFTTGWFLEQRMDEVLPHLDMLVTSVDSARAERHDTIRGLPGLHARLMRAIPLVKQRYPLLSVQFNCCVQQGIAAEIDDLIALAESKGIPISFDVITEHRNGADGSHFTETSMGLPLAELQEVCRTLLARKRAGAPILNSELYFQYFIDGRPGYRCHLPKMAMFVDGRGYVENCLDLDAPLANIRETPLAEIMELPTFKQLRQDAERCSSCSSPTMVDLSHVWQNPLLVFQQGGVALG